MFCSCCAQAELMASVLFGVKPVYRAFTYPLENGHKLYYPSIQLGHHKDNVNMLYADRESAIRAAAAHCFAKLQATLQVRYIFLLL